MTEKQKAALEVAYFMAMDNAKTAHSLREKAIAERVNASIFRGMQYDKDAKYYNGLAFGAYLILKEFIDAERIEKLKNVIDNI